MTKYLALLSLLTEQLFSIHKFSLEYGQIFNKIKCKNTKVKMSWLKTVQQLQHNTTSNSNKGNTYETTDKNHMVHNRAMCSKDMITN